LPSKILKIVLKNTASLKNRLVKKIPDVSELLNSVMIDATPPDHAGKNALKELSAPTLPTTLNALLRINVSMLPKSRETLLQLLRLTLNNALRKNVPTNGPAARRILSAFLLSRNARKNAEPNSPAGNYASPKKETHLQPTSPSVLPKNTALENLLNSRMSLPSWVPNSVSETTALEKLRLVEKIKAAFELFKLARKNAMMTRLAGLTALLKKVTLLLKLSGNASLTTTASIRLKLLLLL